MAKKITKHTNLKKVLAALTCEHQYTLQYYIFNNNKIYMIMQSTEFYKDNEH